MPLTHLHLHVRDRTRAEDFYSAWFAMGLERRGDEITFMTDEGGFLLALMEDSAPAPLPAWFHFGFRLPSLSGVLDLHERMLGSSVPIGRGLFQDESFASFRCVDPDGYLIEVYWDAAPN